MFPPDGPSLPPAPELLRLRDDVDLVALVLVTLGFAPHESVVLVSTDPSGRLFMARLDVPEDVDDLEAAAEVLAGAAKRNDADTAMLLAYTADTQLAVTTTAAVARAVAAWGVAPTVRLQVSGGRLRRISAVSPRLSRWRSFDLRSHPTVSAAVLEGRALFQDRAELEASLAVADPDFVADVEDWCRDETVAGLVPDVEGWVDAVGRALVQGVPDQPVDVAGLLLALRHVGVRDAVISRIDARSIPEHLQLWTDVVRRAPLEWRPDPAALLAFCAWQAGEGALAACAVDRALEADPDHHLAHLVEQALQSALPPSRWWSERAGSSGSLPPGDVPL